jgi:hypothetical protein
MTPRPLPYASLLVAIFVADMLFLPMFHTGPLPFKAAYWLMLLGVPTMVRQRHVRPLLTIVAILVAVCWIGAVYLWALERTAEFSETIRNTAIFAMMPLAFAFGWRARPRSCDFLLLLLPAYFAVNAVLSYWYRELPWLISFYGLEDRVTSGLFDIRSPGIHYNPNLSALAANLLLLGLVTADRAGLVRTAARWPRLVAFASVMGTHALMGSRGELLSAVAIGGFWLFYRAGGIEPQRLLRFAAISCVAAVLLATAFVPALDWAAERNATAAFVKTQFTSTLTVLPADITDPNARTNSLLLRPFFEAERVVARVERSPVWGSGFDVAAVYPYDNVHFHNDWALVFVAGGLIGLVLFGIVVGFTGSYGAIHLIPFILTASSNSFIRAPNHLLVFFAMLGVIAAHGVVAPAPDDDD